MNPFWPHVDSISGLVTPEGDLRKTINYFLTVMFYRWEGLIVDIGVILILLACNLNSCLTETHDGTWMEIIKL